MILVSLSALADENGIPGGGALDCNSSTMTSVQFICDTVQKISGSNVCKSTANTCFTANQELFTGVDMKKYAGPTQPWNGLGLYGLGYEEAGLCLLRDLKFTPLVSQATASTALGQVKIDQEVRFVSFDPVKKTMSGYHRANVCVPVIGCLDLFIQNFTFSAKQTDFGSSGPVNGIFQLMNTNGLTLETDGLSQGLAVELPALAVDTPYGQISANPEFAFSKSIGWSAAPFDGNTTSLIPGIGGAHMTDLYGRNPGVGFIEGIKPTKYAQGWISQLALGGRDANPKSTPWKPVPTSPTLPSVRPDLDISSARSTVEKTPNGSLSAAVKLQYSPTDMIPAWLRDNSFISISFDIFVRPTIAAAVTSQFGLYSHEITRTTPFPAPLPLDNYRQLQLFGGSSAAGLFALDAGVDLTINLDVGAGPFSIHETLIDVHPETVVAETVDSGIGKSPEVAWAKGQMSQLKAGGSFFTSYRKFDGNEVNGEAHIQACLAKPTAPDPLPSPPTYVPGDPNDLTKNIQYPCDICIGAKGTTYTNPSNDKPVVVPSFLKTIFPANVDNLPPALSWKCDALRKVGCYDMCTWDLKTHTLSVVESALQMTFKGVPGNRRCK